MTLKFAPPATRASLSGFAYRAEKPQPRGPEVSVKAPALFLNYDANALQADQEYKDRWVRVTGTLHKVDSDPGGYFAGMDVAMTTTGPVVIEANVQADRSGAVHVGIPTKDVFGLD